LPDGFSFDFMIWHNGLAAIGCLVKRREDLPDNMFFTDFKNLTFGFGNRSGVRKTELAAALGAACRARAARANEWGDYSEGETATGRERLFARASWRARVARSLRAAA
jgi:hypothetical protein